MPTVFLAGTAVTMMPRTLGLSALFIAVGCNSPSDPPVAQVPVSDVTSVVEHLEPELLGCGVGTWNGKDGGMYRHDYYDVETPWKWRNVERLSIAYAGPIREEFLASVSIDGHQYRRDAPSERHLTWRRYTGD